MTEKVPLASDQPPPYDFGNPANTAPYPPNQPPLNQPGAYPPYQQPPPGQPGAYPPYQQPPPGQPGAYPPYQQPPPGQPGAYQQPPGVYPGGNQPGYGPKGVAATVVVTQPRTTPVVVQTAPRQSDWMIPAILACLFCFWPTGICAIIAASNANSAVSSGNAALIEKRMKTARNLTLLTVFLGIVFFIIIGVLRVVIANQTTYYG